MLTYGHVMYNVTSTGFCFTNFLGWELAQVTPYQTGGEGTDDSLLPEAGIMGHGVMT